MQDYATVDGEKVEKGDFGYAPGDEPSKWKFPLHNKEKVESAIDMFHHEKGIPAEAMAELKRKIIERAHKFGVDEDKIKRFEGRPAQKTSETSSEFGRSVQLLCLGEPVAQDGKTLYEVPIVVPGQWVKGGERFSITRGDLAKMVVNFNKRLNGMVGIDYEHASEFPEVARGGPVPAAGWIHNLSLNGELTARVEWTPQAQQMIRSGEYRFFSPAIDWSAKDKETGEPQGATLTSGALTNKPFLEELPPIVCSEKSKGEKRMAEKEKAHELPVLNARKGRAGSAHEGHHVFSDGDSDVGYMSDSDFQDYAEKHGKQSSGDGNDDLPKVMSEIFSESGLTRDQARDKLKSISARIAEIEKSEAEATHCKLLFAEAVKDGKLDREKAKLLARDGKIALSSYIAAEEAERALDEAIRKGKILPRHRAFFFHDAIERPAEFAEFVKGATAVPLGIVGVSMPLDCDNADDEAIVRTKAYMSEHKLQEHEFGNALKKVLAADPELERRYRGLARERVRNMPPNAGSAT